MLAIGVAAAPTRPSAEEEQRHWRFRLRKGLPVKANLAAGAAGGVEAAGGVDERFTGHPPAVRGETPPARHRVSALTSTLMMTTAFRATRTIVDAEP